MRRGRAVLFFTFIVIFFATGEASRDERVALYRCAMERCGRSVLLRAPPAGSQ
jgi:hypothetical protein